MGATGPEYTLGPWTDSLERRCESLQSARPPRMYVSSKCCFTFVLGQQLYRMESTESSSMDVRAFGWKTTQPVGRLVAGRFPSLCVQTCNMPAAPCRNGQHGNGAWLHGLVKKSDSKGTMRLHAALSWSRQMMVFGSALGPLDYVCMYCISRA